MTDIIDQSSTLLVVNTSQETCFTSSIVSAAGSDPTSRHYQCIDGQTQDIVAIDGLLELTTGQGQDGLNSIGDYPCSIYAPTRLPSSDQALASSHASPASGSDILLAAKQLRTQCFSSSYGATFDNDLDSDEYDEACLHIILQEGEKVIATARVLDSQRAALLGRFYSENEFQLEPILKHYPYRILEVGRTCIHPNYRSGKVLRQLWLAITEIAKYLNVNAFMGCCSIPIGAGDINGWLRRLDNVTKLNIKPKYQLPPTVLTSSPMIPPLLNTYLKMGASLSEQACFDVSFHCADVFVWLPFEQVNKRYQHLL